MAHSKHKLTPASCPDCDYGPFTRNHYFTGKLLVERDFTDEQRYYVEKLLHHHQRLHGWGVVCGLKVKQHENENCRDRYVVVEPGTAIDCCGHNLLVLGEELFDFRAKLEQVENLDRESAHTLQICLRYRECPTEDIPVLYDDCGCDDTKCAPNRILESYEFDVIIDPDPSEETLQNPKLRRTNTVVNLARASRVALDDSKHQLYVLADKIVYQVDTDTHAVTNSYGLPADGMELAISNNGERLYVVTENPTKSRSKWRRLVVLDTSNLTPVRRSAIEIPESMGHDVRLAVAPDKSLITLIAGTNHVYVWGTDLDSADKPEGPSRFTVPDGVTLRSLVISSDARHIYAAGPDSAEIQVLKTADRTSSPSVSIPDVRPTLLAKIRSTGPDVLAVTDENKQLYIVSSTGSPATLDPVDLAHQPIAMAVSPGGRWLYVLERDEGSAESYLQVINVHALQQKLPVTAGAPLKVGSASQQLLLAQSGARLYIPDTGAADPERNLHGGVAVVEVSEQDCQDILWRHLDGCPHCEDQCIVLATIENYRFNDRIEDQTNPPADPKDDAGAAIARIDNRKGRRLLPSTQVLTEYLKCVLQQGSGKQGVQGPPGQPGLPGKDGEPGPGIDAVDVQLIPCNQEPAPPKLELRDDQRTLVLEIPSGCDDLEVKVNSIPCNQEGSGRIETIDGQRTLVLDLPSGAKDLAVQVNSVPCDQPGAGRVEVIDGRCTLVLDIPNACQEMELPHICAINWPHNGNISRRSEGYEIIQQHGLIIVFDAPVLAKTLNEHTFQVLYRHDENRDIGYEISCYCNVRGEIVGVELELDSPCEYGRDRWPAKWDVDEGTSEIHAVRFKPKRQDNQDVDWLPGDYRVVLLGDFVLGSNQISLPNGTTVHPAVDADHLGPGLPWPQWISPTPPPSRAPTGDGVEGGTFKSWFRIGEG